MTTLHQTSLSIKKIKACGKKMVGSNYVSETLLTVQGS